MKVIYKYPLSLTDDQIITGPIERVIYAGFDPIGQLCVWCEASTDYNDISKRVHIFVIGTGNPVPKEAIRFINSVRNDPFMWHIYSDSV